MRRIVAALSCSLLLAGVASAQSAPFQTGQWGVEANVGGGSGTLLRFTSPTSAFVLGGSMSFRRSEIDFDSGTSASSEMALISMNLGRRAYRRATGQIRPYSTLGITVGAGTQWQWLAGVFGDIGASYFVTDRLNIAAAGVLTAQYQESDLSGNLVTQTSFQVSGPRLSVGFLF